MIRNRILASALLLGLSAAAFSTSANAAPCRDAHGRFVTCSASAAKPHATKAAVATTRKATPAKAAPARTAAKTVAKAKPASKPAKVASTGAKKAATSPKG